MNLAGGAVFCLVLDSSVIIGDNFSFQSTRYKELVRLANDHKVKVLLPDLIMRELESNIKSRVSKAKKALSAFQNDAFILKNIKKYSDNYFSTLDPKFAKIELNSNIDNFVKASKAIVLQTKSVCDPEILNLYFDGKAPFKPSQGESVIKDKRFEFPDAIALSAVKKWSENNQSEHVMVLVSKDKGWTEFGTGTGFEVVDSIQKAIDMVLQANLDLEKFEEEIKKNSDLFGRKVVDKFKDGGFYVDGADSELLDLTDFEYDGVEVSVLSFNQKSGVGKVWVNAMVTFSAEVQFADESSGIYDSEEKEMMYLNYEKDNWYQVLGVDAECDVTFDVKTNKLEILNAEITDPLGDVEVKYMDTEEDIY